MKVALMFVFLVNSACSYKILALFPMQAKSHFIMYQKLLEGLAEKGHEVDVLSHFPLKTPIARYTDLSLKGTMPDFVNNVTLSMFKDFGLYEQILDITVLGGVEVCKIAFDTDVVKNLKNSRAKNYDLVITEIFGSDCMLGFGHLFKTPIISVISSVNLPWASDRIGTIDNPSYIPNYFSLYTSDMSFLERLHNTWMLIFTKTIYYFYSTKATNEIMRQFFGEDTPSVENLAKNTSLILVNSHNSIHQSRPALPNFIEVGGLHITQTKNLPKHLSDTINEGGHKGVVYLSMGSMVVTESFEEDKLQGLFDAFSELPYKILWKADRKRFPQNLLIPNNIYFEPWMPQLDILCDPNVKLFVTHGGLMGMQEAVYCGVPLLGIPLFADQDLNIKQSVMKGFAQKVAYDDITKETVLKAAKHLLDNPSVRVNIKKASSLFKDRQNSPLETAIYWVEHVIRHKGAPHLRSRGADLAWYQYHLIDLLVVVLTITIIVLVVIFLAVKLLVKKFLFSTKLKIN